MSVCQPAGSVLQAVVAPPQLQGQRHSTFLRGVVMLGCVSSREPSTQPPVHAAAFLMQLLVARQPAFSISTPGRPPSPSERRACLSEEVSCSRAPNICTSTRRLACVCETAECALRLCVLLIYRLLSMWLTNAILLTSLSLKFRFGHVKMQISELRNANYWTPHKYCMRQPSLQILYSK